MARPERAPTGDWMTLAPLTTTVRPPSPTFRVQTLAEILPTHQPLRLTGNLGHSVSPQAPSGVVEGMAVTNHVVQALGAHGDLPLRAPRPPEPAAVPVTIRRLAISDSPAPAPGPASTPGPALPEPAVSRVLASPAPLSPPASAPLPVARVIDPAPPPASSPAPAGSPDGAASTGMTEGEAAPAEAALVGDDRVGGFAADLAELTAPPSGSGMLRPAPPELAPPIQPRTLQRRPNARTVPVQRVAGPPGGASPMAAANRDTPAPASGEAPGEAGGSDAVLPAGTDTGLPLGSDAGLPAGTDTGLALGSDAGLSAGTDTGLAPGIGAALPAGTETGLSSGTDAGLATGIDTGLAPGTDTGLAAGTDTGLAAGTDTGLAPGIDAALPAGTETGLSSGTDAGLAAGTDAGRPPSADDDWAAEPLPLQTSPLLGGLAPRAEKTAALAEPAPLSDLVLRQPAGAAAPASPITDDEAPGAPPEEPGVMALAPGAETPAPEASVPDAPLPEAARPDAPLPEAPVPDAALPEAPVPDAALPEAPVPDAALPEAPLLGAAPRSTTSAMSTTTSPQPDSPTATGPAAAPAATSPDLTLHGSSSTPAAPATAATRRPQLQRQADGPILDPSSGGASPAVGEGDDGPRESQAGGAPAGGNRTRTPAAPDVAVVPTLGIGAAGLALSAQDGSSGIAGVSEGPAAPATAAVSRLPLAPAEQPGSLAAPGRAHPGASSSGRALAHTVAGSVHSPMSNPDLASPPVGSVQLISEGSAQGGRQPSRGTAAPLETTLQLQAAAPSVGGIFSSPSLAHPLPLQRATPAAMITPASAMTGPVGAMGLDGSGDQMPMVQRLEGGIGPSGGSSPSAGPSPQSEALPLHTPAAGAPTAADIVVKAGLAERQNDGTLLYTSPPGGQVVEAVVQRRLSGTPAAPPAAEIPPADVAPAPQAPEVQAGGQASGAAAQSPEELDLLARRLYKRLRSEMQTDIARQLEAKNRAGRYRR